MLTLKISEIAQKLQEGKLSALELCKMSLKRADIIKSLNAFVKLLENNAVTDAKNVDLHLSKNTYGGMMQGITVAVKDNFCMDGVETTCSSKMLSDFVPSYNATIVQRLQDAGAVIIGKTNMDEFAMGSGTVDSIHGPTKNVWGSEIPYVLKKGNVTLKHLCSREADNIIAGGSSGGSAVAVASGVCFGALGSDTGGSTRNPASYCGVVGLKPTYGSVSRYGLIPLVNSMDVPGIIARSVEDTACIFNTVSGFDEKDSTTVEKDILPIVLRDDFNISGIRVGIPKEYHCYGLAEVVLNAWSHVADVLEEAGATVVQISMPHTSYSIACYSVLNQCEVSSNMARYDGLEFGYRALQQNSTEQLYADSRSNAFNDVVRGRILAGNYFLLQKNYEKYFVQALKVRRLIAEDFVKAWSSVDILLTPTTLTEPPLMKQFLQLDNRTQSATQDYCTQPANMAGCPAVSFPVCLSHNNLPISLQLIAPNFCEQTLLSVCQWLEKTVQFPCLHIED
ncbi:glutamyl-tRNA(Gln) amidotransferase subunit A, mitochondrial [Lycorma delicatula]|uniref:glutamyl-tRNA(Gln) amidotransferase subunit A, mitochondrial n=1 Tax=Lycorma delicatula TaxID=130591 RepID=UPI003F5103B2